MNKIITVLLFIMATTACSWLRPTKELPDIPLLSPALLGQSVQATQSLTTKYKGEQLQLLAVLSIDKEQLSLIGLSSIGQRLLSIYYNGDSLKTESSTWFPDSFDVENIITQLQLVYWPVDELTKAYPYPWRLVSSANERVLYLNQLAVVTVTYDYRVTENKDCNNIWENDVYLHHHLMDLDLEIKPIEIISPQH